MASSEQVTRIRDALRDRPADARRMAGRLVGTAERSGDAALLAMAYFLRGDAQQVLGDAAAAAADYAEARRRFRANGEERHARLVDLSSLHVHALLGEKAVFRRTLARLRRQFPDAPARVVVEKAAGNGWRTLGDETSAEQCFRDALARLGRKRDDASRRLRALVREDLAVSLGYRGAVREARRGLDRAASELAALGLRHAMVATAANRAWLDGIAGAPGWIDLEPLAGELEQLGDRRRALLARLDAADLRLRFGDARAAARIAGTVVRGLERAGLGPEAARARLVVARARRALGRHAAARSDARRAATLFTAAGDAGGRAAARVVAGDPRPEDLAALESSGRWLDALDAVLLQARAADPVEGVALLRAAERRFPPVLRGWLHPDRLRLEAAAAPARAVPLLRRALRAAERVRERAPTAALRATSLAAHLEIYEELARSLLARGAARDRREAFAVLDAARARTLREELGREAPELLDAPRVRKLRARLEELWRTLEQQDRDAEGLRGRASPLLHAIRAQERGLLEALEAGDAAARRAETRYLAPSAPVLTFARIGRRLHGLLAAGEDVRAWDAGPLAALVREMESFRFQVRRRLYGAQGTDAIDRVLARLGRRLLPSDLELPAQLRVVLPVEIGDLPIEALPHDGGPLLTRVEIEYAPFALGRPLTWRADGRELLVGLADAGLAEVAPEIDAIATLRPGSRRLVGGEATRDSILAAARGARLVHLAGHAETRRDAPSLSALRTQDGWVAAADLARARLDRALVVLSACRTGDPALQWNGESMGGFPRAVLAAGASGVIASRWPIADAPARLWMEQMYRNLNDKGPSASVRSASLALRSEDGHPAAWAAFLFVRGGRS